MPVRDTPAEKLSYLLLITANNKQQDCKESGHGYKQEYSKGATFFAGNLSPRYVFQVATEAVLMALIVWNAWK